MRNLVSREDGTQINVARMRGHLFVCEDGCCCGRPEQGVPAVPRGLYHGEWERRRLRNHVHLTIGGCLGPCALANVVMLLFQGRAIWFHSLNSEALVLSLYDYIDDLLDAGAYLPPPKPLDRCHFTASTWEGRPDGQPLYEPRRRPRRDGEGGSGPAQTCSPVPGTLTPERLVADMDGPAAAPRKNGELVFSSPWEGRAFGMAVALNEQQCYSWDEFRARLIARIGAADLCGEESSYYERWLQSFESLLIDKGLMTADEVDERTDEFEWGERDEV